MRKSARVILGVTIAALIGTLAPVSAAVAQEKFMMPTEKQCKDKDSPVAKDAVTQGACVVVVRTKGNCMACHAIAGMTHGNIAPPLVAMKQRFPDKSKLRAQIDNARSFNPKSIMPPYGPHEILTKDEIDHVVEFILTL